MLESTSELSPGGCHCDSHSATEKDCVINSLATRKTSPSSMVKSLITSFVENGSIISETDCVIKLPSHHTTRQRRSSWWGTRPEEKIKSCDAKPRRTSLIHHEPSSPDTTLADENSDDDGEVNVESPHSVLSRIRRSSSNRHLLQNLVQLTKDMPIEHIEGRWPRPLRKNTNHSHWMLDEKNDSIVLSRAIELGSLLIRAVTWNLQGRPTDSAQVLREELLTPHKHHIYMIGTEECENSIAKSVIMQCKKNWEMLLKETLGEKYIMLCGHSLQAIHNVLFVHEAILPLITNVKSAAIATGLGTKSAKLGNKGGVGISFAVGNTNILLVNCHLAAHQDRVEERVGQFGQIKHQLLQAFSPKSLQCDGGIEREQEDLLDTYDHVVWSGDLNFRINAPKGVCEHLLEKQLHNVLIANEQLTIECKKEKEFGGFEEGPLCFMPTYKYDRNCDVYDTSNKQRIPAWTDRILYSSRSGLELQEYDSIQYLRTSDHRPVYATMILPFKAENAECSNTDEVNVNQTTSEVCCVQ